VRPRNLVKLSRFGDRCQPAASTGFPPVFNSKGSFHPDCLEANRRTLLQRARKRASVSARQKNPAHAEAEDDSKIKDRLEALLFAETLQGTLSPNANPGKGLVGGLLNWMPKATARMQRAAQTHSHLSSTRSVIPNRTALRKGRIKKVTALRKGLFERAERRASSPVQSELQGVAVGRGRHALHQKLATVAACSAPWSGGHLLRRRLYRRRL